MMNVYISALYDQRTQVSNATNQFLSFHGCHHAIPSPKWYQVDNSAIRISSTSLYFYTEDIIRFRPSSNGFRCTIPGVEYHGYTWRLIYLGKNVTDRSTIIKPSTWLSSVPSHSTYCTPFSPYLSKGLLEFNKYREGFYEGYAPNVFSNMKKTGWGNKAT